MADNHAHVNEFTGLGPTEVARRFRRSGGRFMVVVSLLTWSLGLQPGEKASVERLYEYTVRSAARVRGEGVGSVAVVGLHPAECYRLVEMGWPIEKVEDFMRWAVDLAGRLIREGAAVGIGEIGRPHWPVPPEVRALCDRVMEYGIGIARDLDAVVHLHLEREGENTLLSVAEIARRAGARPYRVVMHHAEPSVVVGAWERGLVPSVPVGRRGEFEEAAGMGPMFVVESDFIDDNRRPGAVIPPWTMAAKLLRAVEQGRISGDFLRAICVDNMVRLYGDAAAPT